MDNRDLELRAGILRNICTSLGEAGREGREGGMEGEEGGREGSVLSPSVSNHTKVLLSPCLDSNAFSPPSLILLPLNVQTYLQIEEGLTVGKEGALS